MNDVETGVIVASTGICIFLLGVAIMLDKALMVAGNIIIVAGITMFFKANALSLLELDRLVGTAMFSLGLISLFLRHVMLGFMLEVAGLVYIFKRSVPGLRTILARLFYNKLLKKLT